MIECQSGDEDGTTRTAERRSDAGGGKIENGAELNYLSPLFTTRCHKVGVLEFS